MNERLLIAGSGGQGVISIGKMLAAIAVRSVPYVTFFPAYGAEVRGGTSNCQIVLSEDEIASPVSEQFDSMVILNQASLDKFLASRARRSVVIANSSMCRVEHTPDIIAVRASDAALALGNARAANFVMLGAFVACKPLILADEVHTAIADTFAAKGADLVDLNIRAFKRGLALGKAQLEA